MGDGYIIGAYIESPSFLLGVWIYAIASWGFLVGIAIGWLPAIIAAFIAGLLWPLVVLVVIGLIVLILMNL